MYHHATMLLAFTALSLVSSALAGERCCHHCGCQKSCHKVCRLVCEEKKVDIVCYGCKCEDFCVGKKSTPGCQHCEEVCAECDGDPSGVCAVPKTFVWREWIPGCGAEIHTKKKLMKKVVTKKIPSYKWVVEELCDECDAGCVGAEVPPGVAVPPPPLANAPLKYQAIEAVPLLK